MLTSSTYCICYIVISWNYFCLSIIEVFMNVSLEAPSVFVTVTNKNYFCLSIIEVFMNVKFKHLLSLLQ